MIKILTVFSILFLYACSNTSPTNVKTSDVQKITSIEYGFIKSSSPVKIKGESNWVGATAGAMIGGLLGTAVCGEEEIVGTKCQDIAVVFGTIGGAAIGSVTQAKLGDHDGFQYIIDVDSNETLHKLLNEWSDIMPATFEIFPLLDTAQITAFLGSND